jgi:hypothetical protein
MDETATLAALRRGRRTALVVGGAAAIAAVVGAFLDPTQALRSWLVAWLLALGVALGSLAVVLLHVLTGGGWCTGARRILEAAIRTLPTLALGLLPILLGVGRLYPWVHEHATQPRWLNVPFFVARAVACFAAWVLLAFELDRRLKRREAAPTPANDRRARLFAGPALALLGATTTVAAVDWEMSLEPHWRSTMVGLLFLVGQALSAFAFVLFATGLLRARAPFREVATQARHDLGNLTLAFVLLWTYLAYSQYVIVWSANLPPEAAWYVRRLGGGWQAIAGGLVLLHFVVPFLVLLSRKAKRRAAVLMVVGGGLLAMRGVDLFWLVAPSYRREFGLHWLDFAALLAAAGLWTGAWLSCLLRRPLSPPPVLASEAAAAAAH